jgi:outer membrane usher protein FimD/PapC
MFPTRYFLTQETQDLLARVEVDSIPIPDAVEVAIQEDGNGYVIAWTGKVYIDGQHETADHRGAVTFAPEG